MAALRLLRIMSQIFQSTSRTKTNAPRGSAERLDELLACSASHPPTGFQLKVARDPIGAGQSLATAMRWPHHGATPMHQRCARRVSGQDEIRLFAANNGVHFSFEQIAYCEREVDVPKLASMDDLHGLAPWTSGTAVHIVVRSASMKEALHRQFEKLLNPAI